MTEIVVDFPPNIKAIRKVFPISGHEIFAYGGTIYNPSGSELTPALIAHEEVHFRQQGKWPKSWWMRFLKSPAFRLRQELEAHRVEYRVFCRGHKDRNSQAKYLRAISKRLAAPMYGSMITTPEAIKAILA